MSSLAALRPVAPILIGAATMLTIIMGLRQSIGLFVQPAVRDLAITVADFTLAIAIQNLAWGLLQPFAGAWTARWGFRPVMMTGAVSFVAGMALLGTATGLGGVVVGAGLLMGLALACCGSGMANAVASRPVPAAVRSAVLGMVSSMGSLGAMISAPIGQSLANEFGWRAGVAGFVVIALLILPSAWIAGRVDAVPLPRAGGAAERAGTARDATRIAMRHRPFLVMTGAYFVCGLQLVFLTTHLPSYIAFCGMDPMLGAQALGVIGAFNIAGSLFFGWAGGRWSKGALLGALYISRSLVLAWYFGTAPTPANTLVFAALMGFLWLGVSPLVSGLVAEMFGLRWQAMIQGLAFTSHQLGSALGAFGGGWLFDAFGNYELAWRIGVAMGLTAGLIQLATGLRRPPPPAIPAPAG
jgi:predicted MFS family arabinose efflux permease